MELSLAAWASLVGDVDHLLDTRQMRGQRSTVGTVPMGALRPLHGIGAVLGSEALALNLLRVLKASERSVDRQALDPSPEALALKLLMI